MDSANLTSSWPWLVSIHLATKLGFSTPDTQPLCQGSLLTSNSILTAASCLPTSEASRLSVLFINHANKTNFFEIEKLTIHEEFNSATRENDLALLKLKIPVQFTNILFPVCLPISNVEDVESFLALGRLYIILIYYLSKVILIICIDKLILFLERKRHQEKK